MSQTQCVTTVTNHADKRTPDHVALMCWGATCSNCGPLMDGDWYDRATADAAARAHQP